MLRQYNDVILTTEEATLKLAWDHGLYKVGSHTNKFLHMHKYYELFYVVNSSISVVFSDRTVRVGKDEIIIIPPQVLHMILADDDEMIRFCAFVSVEKAALSVDGELTLLSIFDSQRVIPMSEFPEAALAFERLKKYSSHYSQETRQLISACFHEILYLMKLAYRNTLRSSGEKSRSSLDNDELIHIIDVYINTQFANEPSLSELSELLPLSERQTRRMIREIYGRPFKNQLLYLKMQNAARLLAETELTAEYIAGFVGYKSVHGFYTEFEKTFGTTPIEYRKRAASGDEYPPVGQ